MRFTSLLRSVFKSATTSSTNLVNNISESILSYSDSLLVLSLMLPSRQETCRFHFNLESATVGQLTTEIKQEDSGIENVHVYDGNGVLLSKSYSMSSLLNSPFTIQINKQKTFLFDPINRLHIKNSTIKSAKTDGPTPEDTAAALYYALNMMKVYHEKYHELKKEANNLTVQLEPLEKIKDQLAKKCQRYTTRCIWYGLGAMSFQVGALAELTWAVYSWDIVEPMSYFIAYGTVMAAYAFYLMTRADFEYMTMADRIFLRRFYREAERQSFDIALYNRLKNRLFAVNTDLARLRAPLSLSLPVPPNPVLCKVSGEELSPLDLYRTTTHEEK